MCTFVSFTQTDSVEFIVNTLRFSSRVFANFSKSAKALLSCLEDEDKPTGMREVNFSSCEDPACCEFVLTVFLASM